MIGDRVGKEVWRMGSVQRRGSGTSSPTVNCASFGTMIALADRYYAYRLAEVTEMDDLLETRLTVLQK